MTSSAGTLDKVTMKITTQVIFIKTEDLKLIILMKNCMNRLGLLMHIPCSMQTLQNGSRIVPLKISYLICVPFSVLQL